MEKIKNVTAQFFTKYEKHLCNQQELIKTLEVRQEEWINKLLKPQEANQARVYGLDSRLDAGEKMRLKDAQFYKETIKKLVFAME